MPTTYTHYRFGKEVISALPRPLQGAIENHRELFDIGLHGPDILFYHKALIKTPVNAQGYAMHEKMADEFSKKAYRESTRLQILPLPEPTSMALSAILPWTANVILTSKK